MLRALVIAFTVLTLSGPAYAYKNPISRGLADFLNILLVRPVDPVQAGAKVDGPSA